LTPTEVRKLIALAEHGKTRDMAIYAELSRKLDDLYSKIEALNAEKNQHGLSNSGDFNVLARWQRWADIEISKLQAASQKAAKEKDAARQIAIKSVAKVQGLETLLEKALKEELVLKRRRAEQNGQPPDA